MEISEERGPGGAWESLDWVLIGYEDEKARFRAS